MVKRPAHTIELNGHLYNALTGVAVDRTTAEQPHFTDLRPPRPVPQPVTGRKKVIDGYVRQPAKAANSVHAAPHKSATLRRAAVSHQPITAAGPLPPKRSPAAHQTGRSLAAHQPTKAPTLMRQAVKKPVIARKPALVAVGHTGVGVIKPAPGIVPKKMSDTVDTGRLVRAVSTPKHLKVARFYEAPRLRPSPTPVVIEAIPVAATPSAIVAPAPASDIFSRGLQAARSHEQVYISPKKRASRRARHLVTAGALSLLLIAAIGGSLYLNRSSIEMQVAAAQAGFAAVKPGYTPAGFNLEKIDRSAGLVSLQYRALAQEAVYTISQEPSAWNSQTLLDSYVASLKHDYETRQTNGRTVFILTEGSATWVSGGIWYRITGSGQSLTTDQLLAIAASL